MRAAEIHAPKVAGLVLVDTKLAFDIQPIRTAFARMFGDDQYEHIREVYEHGDRLTMPVTALFTDDFWAWGNVQLIFFNRLPTHQHGWSKVLPSDVNARVVDQLERWSNGQVIPAIGQLDRAWLETVTPRHTFQSFEAASGVTEHGDLATTVSGQWGAAVNGWLAPLVTFDAIASKPVSESSLRLGTYGWFHGLTVGSGIGVSQIFGANHRWSPAASLAAGLSVGPTYISVRGEAAQHYEEGFASLRFGGDRNYWPFAVAGLGPMVTGGVVCEYGACTAMALVGLQLYGRD